MPLAAFLSLVGVEPQESRCQSISMEALFRLLPEP